MCRKTPATQTTCRSPKGSEKQIDYILTKRKYVKYNKDAEANDMIHKGSDHRCVMATFMISTPNMRSHCKTKKVNKKLIATIVSSREKGIRRREEGETASSQRMISIQGNQEVRRKNLMKAEDESPTHKRNSKNDNDDETKRMEDMRGKGGGRLKHCTVDGDVPLCLRRNLRDSKEDSSSKRKTYEEKESRSSTQSKTKHCVMNKMASGSEGTCPRSTEEKDEHPKNKEVTFIILQKT